MLSRPTTDLRPEALLVCLQADGQAAALAQRGERLAQVLGCGWSVAVIGPPNDALDAVAQQARRAGARLLSTEGGAAAANANGAAAVAALARHVRATTVIVGPPVEAAQRAGFARALALALPGVTLHCVGTDDTLNARPSALRSHALSAWRDAPAVLAVLALCTLLGLALQGGHEPSSLILVYLAGVVYIALKRSQPAALLTVLGSVLLYDLIFVVRGDAGMPGPQNHLLVSLVMMLVGLLISHLAAQVRAQAAAADMRERRTQALNRLAMALAQARTAESIGLALAQAVHRSLQACAVLLPITPPGEADGPATEAAGHGLTGQRRVLLQAGGQPLAVLQVDLLTREHNTPEDQALLEAFANQGAVALERARFELRSASAAIEAERERLRNTLLAGVSHDFRTPLTTIVGSATSLLEQAHAIGPEQRTALLRGVLTEARRLHALTSNLLDLARMQEGAIQPSLEWCPADELVEEARAAAAPVLGGRSVQVRVDAELAVWCDPRLIGQALINLLDNAARHAGAAARIAVGISASAGHWRLVVQDDGPGIPPGLEQDVFKKFVRGLPAADGGSSAAGGTGLGLAICAAVAQLHGGTITAAAGPGARFELTLPQPLPTRATLEAMS